MTEPTLDSQQPVAPPSSTWMSGSLGLRSAGESVRDMALSTLPPRLLDRVPERLRIAATVAALLFGILLAVEPLRTVEYVAGRSVQLTIEVIAFTLSLFVIGYSRRKTLQPRSLANLGIAYGIVVGWAVWSLELSANFAELAHTPGVPSVCVWLVIFPMVVPGTPFKTAVAGMLTVAGGVGVQQAYIHLGQEAPNATTMFLWYLAATICACVGVGVSVFLNRLDASLQDMLELGSYKLIEPIGEGGMGSVWRAEHKLLARPAAIKRIRSDWLAKINGTQADRAMKRFELEAKATAELRSPHTVELFDYGVDADGHLYYVMELLDGVDLSDLVSRYGPIPASRVVHILKQICESLAEAHGLGLVHRDIKPANLFVGRVGIRADFAKVLDFGTVRETVTAEGSEFNLTDQITIVGTPGYMAPEAAFGDATPQSDIYSLGCVAYWLLTGQQVHNAKSVAGLLTQHVKAAVVPPSERSGLAVPQDLEALVLRCLAKSAADRPDGAMSLRRELLTCACAKDWTEALAGEWWDGYDAANEAARESQGSDSTPLAFEATQALDVSSMSGALSARTIDSPINSPQLANVTPQAAFEATVDASVDAMPTLEADVRSVVGAALAETPVVDRVAASDGERDAT